MSKAAKAQLEEYQAIFEIVNDPDLSVYAKAGRLYDLWYYKKYETAKNLFYLLMVHPGMKKGYDSATKSMHENMANGVHIQYKESYKNFRLTMAYFYMTDEERREKRAKMVEYAKVIPSERRRIEQMDELSEIIKKTGE